MAWSNVYNGSNKNKQTINDHYKFVTYNTYYLYLKGKLRKKYTNYVREPHKSCIFLCFKISLHYFYDYDKFQNDICYEEKELE